MNEISVFTPKLAKIFRVLIAAGSFPVLFRIANITPILNDNFPSQFPLDYRSIAITPIISKVYEDLISRWLYKFVDSIKVFPNTQFGFSKGLDITGALLLLTHDLLKL